VIAIVSVAVLFVGILAVGTVLLVRRRIQLRSFRTDPNAPLTQRYEPQNRLFTVHYPSDFAAKRLEEGTVLLSRRISMVEDEAITVTAVASPITDDVQELARVWENAFRKSIEGSGGRVMGGDLRPAKCPTSGALHDGIEIIDLYRIHESDPVTRWSCVFLAHAYGYKLSYLVPRDRVTEERPLLARIVGATELTR
jgi:hypothetical protein